MTKEKIPSIHAFNYFQKMFDKAREKQKNPVLGIPMTTKLLFYENAFSNKKTCKINRFGSKIN